MKRILFMAGLAVLLSSYKQPEGMKSVVERGLSRSVEQAEYLAKSMESDNDSLPRSYTDRTGLIKSNSHWWCSGFFPGVL